ncbi:MAG: hypothetical protein EXQ94_14410 [Alphaproteobacteria bacterium]|nr:hypothetical protein [Alphaproteobacteria bacterium]
MAYGFAQATRHVVVHAGAIAGPHGAIVFLGAPHDGKSSLAFAAWRMGVTVLGDDRVAIAGDQAFAFPKSLKVRVGPATRARVVPPGFGFQATMAGDRRLVIARSLPGFAPYDERYPLRRIVVVERAARRRSRLASIPITQALSRLLPSAGLARRTPMDVVRTLKQYGEDGALLLVQVGEGDFEAAIEMMMGP